jgi:WD40 repeat protein
MKMFKSIRRTTGTTIAMAALLVSVVTPVAGQGFSSWGTPDDVDEVNTPYTDGCPIQSPDGLSLYMASNRPRYASDTRTDLDIWVAHRSSTDAPFGAPVNVGAPINSLADDFCPTPVRGKGLFFVSARDPDTSCGGADIYFARLNPAHGWSPPQNLGCQVNSSLGEAGPSYFEANGSAFLYFSSGPDIYASEQQADGSFGTAASVAELNSPGGDLRPNVRKDGLEIVFDSNRLTGYGGQDLWFATRASVDDPWSTPVNAGATLNTVDNETRGSFSWDGGTLYFGRTPVGGTTDIYVTSRQKVTGGG